MFSFAKSSLRWSLAAAFTISPLHSQSPASKSSGSSTSIKVETRVVLLDVVVTNDKGEAVGFAENQQRDESCPGPQVTGWPGRTGPRPR